MSPAQPSPPGSDPRLVDLEQQLALDRLGEGVRPLAHYLEHFPGLEEAVAQAWMQARGAERESGGEPNQLGRYRLLEELGRGGQGVVYRARDDDLGREVALKVLAHAWARSDDSTLRLRREAEIVSRLEHPGLCAVYERGQTEGADYVAMRLVRGEDLSERWAREGAPTDCVGLMARAQLVEQLARALHAAHEAGVVHRDVKPRNVVVEDSGQPVLLDFGLAREIDREGLTLSGEVFGTPDYMSPEQLEGAAGLDRRTDVWSLGALLYEGLAGTPPFRAPSVQATVLRIQREEAPALGPSCPGLPPDLAVVCATALEKDRGRRYASALELAEELRRVRLHEPIQARPASLGLRARRWAARHPARAVGGALAALALFVFGVQYERGATLARQKDEAVATLTRLSDLELGARLLSAERDELWPIAPALVEACDTWIGRADELMERRAEHVDLREFLEERRSAEGAFVNDSEAILHERVCQLLEQLDQLESARVRVLDRRGRSSSARARSVDAHAELWASCAAALAQSPVYGGLALEPLVGLVPLGENAGGYWEFWHVESGTRPHWDPERGGVLDETSGLVLVLIPGGEGLLGSDESDFGNQGNEWPLVPYQLDPYFLSKYELTQGQWAISDRGSRPSVYAAGHSSHSNGTRADLCPVESVSWDQADALARRLGLALPTEAQWEYACRAHTRSAFSFGDNWEAAGLYGNVRAAECDGGWVDDGADGLFSWSDPFRVTGPVGSFAPNAYGLHDMHGNVWEWCRDPYGDFEGVRTRAGDGALEQAEDPGSRPIRGGSFLYDSTYARSARRSPAARSARSFDLGLRPVLEL